MHNIAENQKSIKVENEEKNLPTLQDAIRKTLRESSLPTKQISRQLGISYQLLLNASNRNCPFKFSSRHILPLMLLTNNFAILEYLAHETGHNIVKLPQPSAKTLKNELSLFFGIEERWKYILQGLLKYHLSLSGKDRTNRNLIQKLDTEIWGLINYLFELKAVVANKNMSLKEEGKNGK